MSDFFDTSHVTDVGLQGSAGPSVGFWDMVQQGFQQQYRVDSARALDAELQTRWAESLRALRTAGQNFNSPVDPLMYRGFARFVREGTPVTTPTIEGEGYGARINYDIQQPHIEFEEMRRANEAIRQLNNPEIRTFEQILEEVSQMQQGVEMETAAMSERGGALGFVGELIGAIGGSFTLRDPLNVITAPIGAGRTIATRIATDMAVAAGVVTVTEFGDVAPNRALAGLPERDPLFNIAAATVGAGLIRGGIIEPIAYGVRRLRERPGIEDIDFDLRDSQLQQMFAQNDVRPSARAAASVLDDTIFIERNNPYGEGRAASERFVAELRSVQRAMNGEPVTAVSRVLPPVPFEYIQKAADFEIVREQAPLVYARMEQAQAKLTEIETQLAEANSPTITQSVEIPAVERQTPFRSETVINTNRERRTLEVDVPIERAGTATTTTEKVINKTEVTELRTLRKKANIEYKTAYRAVEAEATRLHEKQARVESAQQREASNVLAAVSEGRPFVGPLLRYDSVETLVDRINTINDALDEKAAAAFARQAEGDAPAQETWLTEDGRVDIGLREPVDPEFRIATDEGDMSVADIMRDLQDDVDLVEAIRSCAI